MAGGRINRIKTSELKSRILNLAQTSVYQVKVQPPIDVISYLNQGDRTFNYFASGQTVEIMCEKTSLPGINYFTHEVTNDFPGMSEKMAYRKDFDNTIDFEFMVDKNYDVVEMFDGWVDFIAGQGTTQDPYIKNLAVAYRMRFPEQYKSDVHITKFEKSNIREPLSRELEYTFVSAFPLSISPVEINYNPSQILKYRVSMSYTRYVKKRIFS